MGSGNIKDRVVEPFTTIGEYLKEKDFKAYVELINAFSKHKVKIVEEKK